ncbi:MAG: Hint domain-containing protein [Paracoccaceae bacterium]
MNDDTAILSAVARQLVKTELPAPKQETESPAPSQEKWILPGFFAKSKIQTSFGNLPIEALRRRDQVRTVNGTFVEVKWIDQIKLDVAFLELHPEAHPIFVPKNTFGKSMPNQNMLLSPAQPVKVSGMIGSDKLHSALSLTSRPQVSRMPHSGFTYYLFHCGKPVTVNVDGLWVGNAPE